MTEFSGMDAREAVVDFWAAHSETLPEGPRQQLRDAIAGRDALGMIVAAMEALYTARADIGPEGVTLLGQLAQFIGSHNFYGKGERAAVIAGVAVRIANGGAAEAESDPEIETPAA